MTITDLIFEAFLACKTKAHLLIASPSPKCDKDSICAWQRDLFNQYQNACVRMITPEVTNRLTIDRATIDSQPVRQSQWIAGAEIKIDDLSSSPPLIENLAWNPKSTGKADLVPVRIYPTETINPRHKLLLAFDALIIRQLTGQLPVIGKVIHGQHQSVARIRMANLVSRAEEVLAELRSMLERNTTPTFALNRNCPVCEFENQCFDQAERDDDISLLKVIPPREIIKIRERGIFTVTQLARSFRARRRRVWGDAKIGKYSYSLKARALCDKIIYMAGSPGLDIEGTPVYLDVEGVPEERIYYLIGAKVVSDGSSQQYSFWADSKDDEIKIWRKFLTLISNLRNPVLLHYGGYETAFLKTMQSRHGQGLDNGFSISALAADARNVLEVIRAHIYFPTRSNGLKDIAQHLGFRWSSDSPSGIKSLLLRRKWELSGDEKFKRELVSYNSDDCGALEHVVRALMQLIESSGSSATGTSSLYAAIEADTLKDTSWPNSYGKPEFALPELAQITKCAHWDYQHDRVYVRTNKRIKAIAMRKGKNKNPALPANKVVAASRPAGCPNCGATCFSVNGRHDRTVQDLRFTAGGLKRWVVKNIVRHYKCHECGATFASGVPVSPRLRQGSQLLAYVIHSLISLHISQFQLAKIVQQFFGLPLSQSSIGHMKRRAAEFYGSALEEIRSLLLSGSLIHADETHVSVDGRDSYVWVFTNMEEVVYVWSETREAKTATDFLSGFKGVLVSDFYAAYDSVECPQQKCLIHLIRDLNDAMLKEPFNLELRGFAGEFTGLMTRLVATVDQFGLKKFHLKKHIADVNKMYGVVMAAKYETASTRRFQARLKRYRDKLFTFLEHDNIPWNNNNAEHAVKAFARGIRDTISGRTNKQGIADYLVLLSICQTCEYRGIDFLGFLRSGEDLLSGYQDLRPRQRI